MQTTNTFLSAIRSLAPDLRAIYDALGGTLPEAVDPVVTDYMDAHCPDWRAQTAWSTVHCKACDRALLRPARQTDVWSTESESGIISQGYFIHSDRISQSAQGWIRNLVGIYFNPLDGIDLQTQDYGCCGYCGTEGNTKCPCGAVVGTIHTDCCGPHWFRPDTSAVVTRKGLPLASDADHALLAQLRSMSEVNIRRAVWMLPAPLSPCVDAYLTARLGRVGSWERDAWEDRSRWYWESEWEEKGRSDTRDGAGHLIAVNHWRGGSRRGLQFNIVDGRGTLEWWGKSNHAEFRVVLSIARTAEVARVLAKPAFDPEVVEMVESLLGRGPAYRLRLLT